MLSTIALTSVIFAACGNSTTSKSNHKTASMSKTVSTSKKSSSKKTVVSKDSTSSSTETASSQSITADTNTSSVITSNSQATSSSITAQSSQIQASDSNSISYNEKTLTGFLNKYGMSPTAYKVEHQGMTAYDALKSTPDTMKSSGEIQAEHLMDQGYLDHNGQETDKGKQQAQQTPDSKTDSETEDDGY